MTGESCESCFGDLVTIVNRVVLAHGRWARQPRGGHARLLSACTRSPAVMRPARTTIKENPLPPPFGQGNGVGGYRREKEGYFQKGIFKNRVFFVLAGAPHAGPPANKNTIFENTLLEIPFFFSPRLALAPCI